MKNLFVSAVVALVVSSVVAYSLGGETIVRETVREVVGASAGPENTEHQTFLNGFTNAGYLATTTGGTVRMTTGDLGNVTYLRVNPTSATTLTLPASSTLAGIIPKAGMCRELSIENANATNDVTVTAGTGWDLKLASSTAVVNHSSFAQARYCRMGSSDIALFLNPAGI